MLKSLLLSILSNQSNWCPIIVLKWRVTNVFLLIWKLMSAGVESHVILRIVRLWFAYNSIGTGWLRLLANFSKVIHEKIDWWIWPPNISSILLEILDWIIIDDIIILWGWRSNRYTFIGVVEIRGNVYVANSIN